MNPMDAQKAIGNPLLTRLECDQCGMPICWVYDFDLNGSYFFCDFYIQKKREQDGEQ